MVMAGIESQRWIFPAGLIQQPGRKRTALNSHRERSVRAGWLLATINILTISEGLTLPAGRPDVLQQQIMMMPDPDGRRQPAMNMAADCCRCASADATSLDLNCEPVIEARYGGNCFVN